MLKTVAVEIVGPSASGKSSLVDVLRKDEGVALVRPYRPRRSLATSVLRSSLRTALPFVRQYSRMPSRPWYRYSMMIQLRSNAYALRRLEGKTPLALFDQGPVYLMSILQRALARPPQVDSPTFRRYWLDEVAFWSGALHLVVLLDAPDEVLIDRVKQRGTPNPLLQKDPETACRDIAALRRSGHAILETMARFGGGPSILQIDSGELPPAAIADVVRRRLAGSDDVPTGASVQSEPG